MIQLEHLQVFDLILTVRTPLFIGSGTEYLKNEYLYQPFAKRVSILDQDAFFEMLASRNLVDAYERFILNGDRLDRFLKTDCGLSDEDIQKLVRYSVSAADALQEDKPLQGIKAFQRNAAGQAYVPGAGVKGALRTVYLAHCIQNDPARTGEFNEANYLHPLSCKPKKREDAVNSIFRGVQISDSIPLGDDAMILAGKYDSGTEGMVHQINLCRECVRPDQVIRLKLTLDQSILKGRITKEILLQSIREFSEYYHKTYVKHFKAPRLAGAEDGRGCLILGGGAGFFSKTLLYPYYGEQEGLERAVNCFTQDRHYRRQCQTHKHEQDRQLGISPHMLKYTKFNGQLYPFGMCEVQIE